jgi:hypothetical protein
MRRAARRPAAGKCRARRGMRRRRFRTRRHRKGREKRHVDQGGAATRLSRRQADRLRTQLLTRCPHCARMPARRLVLGARTAVRRRIAWAQTGSSGSWPAGTRGAYLLPVTRLAVEAGMTQAKRPVGRSRGNAAISRGGAGCRRPGQEREAQRVEYRPGITALRIGSRSAGGKRKQN